MTTLADMEMGDARELGYDLEPVVGREVRGRSREALEDAIRQAVDDGGEQAKAVLRDHGVTLGTAGEPEEEPGEDEPPEPDGDLVAIQILSDPIGVDLFRRDVVAYPSTMAQGFPHRRLTFDQARQIIDAGEGRWNWRASKRDADDVLGGD